MWILLVFNIFVSGNSFFPTDSILEVFKKNPEEVLNIYQQNGFLKAKLRVSEDSLLIEEGPQFKIGSITFDGNVVFTNSEIFQNFNTKRGRVFNEPDIENDIELILQKYEDSGYPFCKITPGNFQFRADTVDFELNIKEGELVKISRIIVKGNELTKKYVILRELAIKTGDKFCESKNRKAKEKLEQLEFISSADIDLKGKDELVVNVKEEKANIIEGIIGYKKDEVIGTFNLGILNLFGTGRVLNISWDRPYTTFNSFELGYKEPWLFGKRIVLEGKFSYVTEDTLYIKKRAEALLSFPLNTLLSLNTGACGVWVDSVAEYSGILGLDFNTKSTPGCHYRIQSEYNFKELEKILLNADNNILLRSELFLFISANYYKLFKENIASYDKFKFGGAKTLRGYWENEFTGQKIGWLNLELRKFIGNSFVFPFYDLGYIDGGFKSAYGAGLAAHTPIGLVKVAYGIGEDMGFMEGKIHILLETRF